MSTQQIRDQKGHLLGTISTGPNQQLNARDARGRFLGSYDPHTNVTRDATGRAIGTAGDIDPLRHEFRNGTKAASELEVAFRAMHDMRSSTAQNLDLLRIQRSHVHGHQAG